jgi:uncharacterized protein (UPF0276 family)
MSLFGVGLRTEHFPYLEKKPQTQLDWFEVISENHMTSRGRPWEMLEVMSEKYKLGFHGVSLSIGSRAPLNFDYLKKLKEMISVFSPILVSDHLCWTGLDKSNFHNLLPLPYNKENLNHVCQKLDQVQSFLGREVAMENLSAYLDFKSSTMTEWDFLAEVSNRSGCKILLDVNNIYVNSKNHGFCPFQYIDAIPKNRIAQIHLAGFSDMGTYLFDTHSSTVHENVWELFDYLIRDVADVPVLLEWDEDIPDFIQLEEEVLKAKKIWERYHGL